MSLCYKFCSRLLITCITVLLLLVGSISSVKAQSAIVINPTGGKKTDNDILTVVYPSGKLNLYYKGFRQNYTGAALGPNPATTDPGSAPQFRVKFVDAQGKVTPNLINIQFCSVTPLQGTGTVSDPIRATVTGTVIRPNVNPDGTYDYTKGYTYYVTYTVSWINGSSFVYLDFSFRSPANLPNGTNEVIHLYLDDDGFFGNNDFGRGFKRDAASGQTIGTYRKGNNVDCAGDGYYNTKGDYSDPSKNVVDTLAYGYKKNNSFQSYYTGYWGSRMSNVDKQPTTNLGTVVDESCTDAGVAVNVAFPAFSGPGITHSKRVLLGVAKLPEDFDTFVVDELIDGIGTSSPVTIDFAQSAMAGQEGDTIGTAPGLKVKVGGGVLATDQVVGIKQMPGGTAILNTDFSFQSSFIIPAGDYTTPKVFPINPISIIGNTTPQKDRTIALGLDVNCNDLVTLGVTFPTTTYTILDDDKLRVAIVKVSDAYEKGETKGSFKLVVENARINSDLTVSLSIGGSTALNADFKPLPGDTKSPSYSAYPAWYTKGVVTIPAAVANGAGTREVPFDIQAFDDHVIEGPEYLKVTITGVKDNKNNALVIAPDPRNSATINIIDNPDDRVVSFSADKPSVDGNTSDLITVKLKPGVLAQDDLDIIPLAGDQSTASAGVNYKPLPAKITIPRKNTPGKPDTNQATFSLVALNGGVLDDPARKLILTANLPDFTTVNPATVAINDLTNTFADKRIVTVKLAADTVKGGNTVNVKVSLPDSVTTANPLTVTLNRINNSTAVQGTDYSLLPATVIIPAGQRAMQFSIDGLNGGVIGGYKWLGISGPAEGARNPFKVVGDTLVVTDLSGESAANRTIKITAPPVKGGDSAVFTISLPTGISSASAIPVTLAIDTDGSTAAAGVNYIAPNAFKVTIPVGASSITYKIASRNEGVINGKTSLILTGQSGDGYTVTPGTAQINDNSGSVADNMKIVLAFAQKSIDGNKSTQLTASLPAGIRTATPLTILLERDPASTAVANTNYVMPDKIEIPAMGNSKAITVTAKNGNVIDGVTSLTVNGKLDGFVVKNDVLEINDRTGDNSSKKKLTVVATPDNIDGGKSTTFVISLPEGVTTQNELALTLQRSNGSTATAEVNYGTFDESPTIPAKGNSVSVTVTAKNSGEIGAIATTLYVTAVPGDERFKSVTSNPVTINDKTGDDAGNRKLALSFVPATVSGGNPSTVKVSLPANITTADALDVTITADNTSAKSGVNYNPLASTVVTIPAGGHDYEFDISTLPGNVIGSSVNLLLTASAKNFTNGSATLLINNNVTTDNKSISLSTSPVSVDGGKTVAIRATLKAGITSSTAVTVNLSRTDNTDLISAAKEGVDYEAYPNPFLITIPAGQPYGEYILKTKAGNILGYPTKTIQLKGEATGYIVSKGQVQIKDMSADDNNNKVLTITSDVATLNGGDVATVTVSLPAGIYTSGKIRIPLIATNASTAVLNKHYDGFPASVTIPANDNHVTFTVTARNANIIDGPSANLIISGNDLPDGFTVKQPLSLTINDKTGDYDANRKITISANPDSVYSGSNAPVLVSLPEGITTANPIKINLSSPALKANTAVAGKNYDAASLPSQVTIEAGKPSATFNLKALSEGIIKGSTSLVLSAIASKYPEIKSTTIRILDTTGTQNTNRTISINAVSKKITGDEVAQFVVSLPPNVKTSGPVSIALTRNDGYSTAKAGTDYNKIPESVTIPAGESQVTFTVNGKNRGVLDGVTTLAIDGAASSDLGVDFIVKGETLQIQDNTKNIPGKNVITITGPADAVSGGKTATLTVSLPDNVITAKDLTVVLNRDNTSSAADGIQYESLPAQVVIPAQGNAKTFVVGTKNGGRIDGLDTLVVGGKSDGYIVRNGMLKIADGSADIAARKIITISPAVSEVAGGNSTTYTVSLPVGITTKNDLEFILEQGSESTAKEDVNYEPFKRSVIITANKNAATFELKAKNGGMIGGDPTQLTITAKPQDTRFKQVTSSPLNILDKTSDDPANKKLTLTVTPNPVTGGNNSTLKVSLPPNITTATALRINILAAEDPDPAGTGRTAKVNVNYLPFAASSITIPAGGHDNEDFRINTLGGNIIGGSENLFLKAVLPGFTSDPGKLVINNYVPNSKKIITVNSLPAITNGGDVDTIRVTLPEGFSTSNNIDVYLNRVDDVTGVSAAKAGIHYAAYPDPLVITIPAGKSSADYLLTTLPGNTLGYPVKTMELGGQADLYTVNAGTVQIKDMAGDNNANKVLTFTSDVTTLDGGNKANITISLPDGVYTASEIKIPLGTDPQSTAVLNKHYYALPPYATIKANERTVTFQVAARNAGIIDGPSASLLVTGKSLPAGFSVKQPVTLTINDKTGDDANNRKLRISSSPNPVNSDSKATYTVSLPEGITTDKAVKISLVARNLPVNPAVAGKNYVAASLPPQITIEAGKQLATFDLTTLSSGIIGGTTQLALTGNAENVDKYPDIQEDILLIKDTTGTAVSNRTISIKADTKNVNGGDEVKVTVSLPDKISTASDITVALNRNDISSSAVAGIDYSNLPAAVTIDKGTQSKSFTLKALNGGILDNVTKLVIDGVATGAADITYPVTGETLQITDNTKNIPGKNVITLVASPSPIVSGKTATVTVSLPADVKTLKPLTITLSRDSKSSAQKDVHYVSLPESVTISAFGNAKTFTVITKDGGRIDGLDTLTINGTAAGYVVNSGMLQITDNTVNNVNKKKITVQASPDDIPGDSTATFVVSLPPGVTTTNGLDFTLEIATGSTASEGVNFKPFNRGFTMRQNLNSDTFKITALNGGIIDGAATTLLIKAVPVDTRFTAAISNEVTIEDKTGDKAENKKLTVTLKPAQVKGGTGSTLKVSLPSGITTANPLKVAIAADANASSAKVNDNYLPFAINNITIPASGHDNEDFVISTLGGKEIGGSATLSLGATASGYGTGKAMLTINNNVTGNKKAITISALPAQVNGGQNTTIRVALPEGITTRDPIVVSVSREDIAEAVSAAKSGVDFTALPDPFTITIPGGQGYGDYILQTKQGNTLGYAIKTVQLKGAVDAVDGFTVNSGQVQIKDMSSDNNDKKVLQFSTDKQTLNGGDKASITVSLPDGIYSSAPLVIPLGTSTATTATAGTDYDGLPASVTIPAGGHSYTFQILARNAGVLDGSPTVLAITGVDMPDGFTVAKDVSLTINDKTGDDNTNRRLRISAAPKQVNSGNTAAVTISLPGGITTAKPIVVNLTTPAMPVHGAVAGKNYQAASMLSQVTIPARAQSVKFDLQTLSAGIIGDTVSLAIMGAALNSRLYPDVKGDTLRIVDTTGTEETNRTISIVATPDKVSGEDVVNVTVSLPKNIKSAAEIKVALTRDEIVSTAVEGTDYNKLPQTATIPAGENSASFSIKALNGNTLDGVTKLLINGNATSELSTAYLVKGATIQITDNTKNIAGRNVITMTCVPDVLNGGQTATVTVSLPAGVKTATAIPVILSRDNVSSAIAGKQYVSLPDKVTIPAQGNAKQFTITTKNGGMIDGLDMLTIQGSATGYDVKGTTLQINDLTVRTAGKRTISLQAIPDEINGGSSTYFRLSLPEGVTTRKPLEFNLDQGSGSTAAEDVNYVAFDGTVRIPADSGGVTFKVTAKNAGVLNADPTTLIIVAKPADDRFGQAISNAVTIQDKTGDDPANKKFTVTLRPATVKGGAVSLLKVSLPQGITTATPLKVNITSGDGSGTNPNAVSGINYQAFGISSITIPAGGHDNEDFVINTLPGKVIGGATQLALNAAATGFTGATAQLLINNYISTDKKVISINALPALVNGGDNATIRASLPDGLTAEKDITVTLKREDDASQPSAAKPEADYERFPDPFKIIIKAGEAFGEHVFKTKEGQVLGYPDKSMQLGGAADEFTVNSGILQIKDMSSDNDANKVLSFTAKVTSLNGEDKTTITVSLPAGITTAGDIKIPIAADESSTAVLNKHYYALPPTVTIPANKSSATFDVTARNAGVIDGPSAQLIITGKDLPAGFKVKQTAALTINDKTGDDDKNRQLNITVTPAQVNSGTKATVEVSLPANISTAQSIPVNLSTAKITVNPAVAGQNYKASSLPAQVIIPAGKQSVTFDLETLSGGTIGGSTKLGFTGTAVNASRYPTVKGDTLQIIDTVGTHISNRMITITPAVHKAKGEDLVEVTVSLPSGVNSAADIDVAISRNDVYSTAAAGTDYDKLPSSVKITAGKNATAFTVKALNGGMIDGTTRLRIDGIATSSLPNSFVVNGDTLQIIDNTGNIAGKNVITITPDEARVLSGKTTTITVSLPAGLRTASDLDVMLKRNPTSGAKEGVQYISLPEKVTIPAQKNAGTFVVSTRDGGKIDGLDVLTIDGTATGFTVNSGTLQIADNTGANSVKRTITVNASPDNIQGGDNAVFTVSLPPGVTTSNALEFTLEQGSGSTAVETINYLPFTRNVKIGANANAGTFTVTAKNAGVIGGDPTMLSITAKPVDSRFVQATSNKVTIEDRTGDNPANKILSVVAQPGTVSGGSGSRLKVSLPPDITTAAPLQISFAIDRASTASANVNYQPLTADNTVTIPAGGHDNDEFLITTLPGDVIDKSSILVVNGTSPGYGTGQGKLIINNNISGTKKTITIKALSTRVDGGKTDTIRVSLPEGISTDKEIAVHLTREDDMTLTSAAKEGIDYVAFPDPLVVKIPAGGSYGDYTLTTKAGNTLGYPLKTIQIGGNTSASGFNIIPGFVQIKDMSGDNNANKALTFTADVSTLDGEDKATITVSLPEGINTLNEIKVPVTADNSSTAVLNKHYYPLPASVTIPAGKHEGTFQVTARNAGVIDGPSANLVITAKNLPGGFTVQQNASLTINDRTADDDRNRMLRISNAPNPVSSGSKSIVQVSLPENITTAKPIVINITTPAMAVNAAVAGKNYKAASLPAQVTIPAGAQYGTFNLEAIADGVIGGRTNLAIMGNAVEADKYPDIKGDTLQILDATGTTGVTLSINADKHIGMGTDVVNVNVSLPEGINTAGDIDVALKPNDFYSTAVAGVNYDKLPVSVQIRAGKKTVSFPVRLLNGGVLDGSTTLMIDGAVTTVSGINYQVTSDTIHINDNTKNIPGKNVITLEATPNVVAGGKSLKVTATLPAGVKTAAPLDISLSADADKSTAKEGVQYVSLLPKITIPKSDNKVSFNVVAKNGGVINGEDILVIVGKAAGYVIDALPVTIQDKTGDDPDKRKLFVTARPDLINGGGSTVVTVSLPEGITTGEEINVAMERTTGSSAVEGVNYETLPAIVKIGEGKNSGTFTVKGKNSGMLSAPPTDLLMKATATGFTAGSGSLKINDNTDQLPDTKKIFLTVDPNPVKGGSTATVTVSLPPHISTFNELSVKISANKTASTAVEKKDYQSFADISPVIIPMGSHSATFQITALNGGVIDGSSILVLTGSAGTGYTDGECKLKIADNTGGQSINKIVTLSAAPDPVTGGSPAVITATLPKGITAAKEVVITLTQDIANSAAVEGKDFEPFFPAQLTIPAGSNTGSVTLTTKNGGMLGYPLKKLSLAGTSDGFKVNKGLLQIKDMSSDNADLRAIAITAKADSVDGGNTIEVKVSLADGITTNGSLNVNLFPGATSTAIAGVNYEALPGNVSIPDGANGTVFTLKALNQGLLGVNAPATKLSINGKLSGFQVDPKDMNIRDVSNTNPANRTINFTISSDVVNEGGVATVKVSLPDRITTSDDIHVKVIAAKTSTLTKYKGMPEAVVIPAKANSVQFNITDLEISNAQGADEIFTVTGEVTGQPLQFAINPATFKVLARPLLKVKESATVCYGATFNLSSMINGYNAGAYVYRYNNTIGEVIPEISAINRSGLYSVTATDNVTGLTSLPVKFAMTVVAPPALTMGPVQKLCIGNNVDLTKSIADYDTLLNNYTFSAMGGASITNGVTRLNNPGNYTYLVSIAAKNKELVRCQFTDTIHVEALDAPAIVLVAAPEACIASSIDLHQAIGNFDATLNNYTYRNAAGDILGSAIVKSAVSGEFVYTVTATNKANGCASPVMQIPVSVNPTPVVVVHDPAAVCQPARVNLTSPLVTSGSDGGLSFKYYADAEGINELSNASTVSESGRYYIRGVSNLTGCTSSLMPVNVIVNSKPVVITKAISICGPGNNVDLGSGITNYTPDVFTYSFRSPDGQPMKSRVVSLASEYKVIATNKTTGCISDVTPLKVLYNEVPTVKVTPPAPVYDPYTVNLILPGITAGSDSKGGGDFSYTWYSDAAGTREVVAPDKVGADGTYYVKGRTATGCVTSLVAVPVNILPRPVALISKTELTEGESKMVTVSFPAGVTLPDAVTLKLTRNQRSTAVPADYSHPDEVTIPANTNAVTIKVSTNKNSILRDEKELILDAANDMYHAEPGSILIHDQTSLEPGNMVLTIGNGVIYDEGGAMLSISLPEGITLGTDLNINIKAGAGTTLSPSNYTLPATITLKKGQRLDSFMVIAKSDKLNKVETLKVTPVADGFTAIDGEVTVKQNLVNVIPMISDNGDGINEFLKIENIEKYPDNDVTVVNRWGDVVYKAKGYNNTSVRFNGIANMGTSKTRLPDGVYFYMVNIRVASDIVPAGNKRFTGYLDLKK